MSTSSVPTAVPALLERIRAKGLDAFEAWPGPSAKPEMVVLGQATWEQYEIATIKAGRKHRQEQVNIAWALYVAGAENTTPADPTAARVRGFELLAKLEDIVADDVTAGAGYDPIQWIEVRPEEAEPVEFEKGWAYRIAGQFVVRARLT